MELIRAVRWLASCLVVVASGCARVPALVDTAPSAQALMTEVLAAVVTRDEGRLARLAVSETEFRDHLWPHLPAARPERNLPMSYVWGDLRQKGAASLARTLATYAGTSLTLVDVRFTEAAERYGDASVHGDTILTVRRAGGADEDIRICGSLVEQGGRWKVFSYVVDD